MSTNDKGTAVAGPALSEELGASRADAEQAAFEKWLIHTCPNGDCEEVQRQWERSYAYSDLEDEFRG